LKLRTAADAQVILPAIREAVAKVNTNLPLFDVKTESQQIDRLLFQERLVRAAIRLLWLLALVAGLRGIVTGCFLMKFRGAPAKSEFAWLWRASGKCPQAGLTARNCAGDSREQPQASRWPWAQRVI